MVGPVMMILPAEAPADAPEEIRSAIEARRQASISGRCACGAERRLKAKHGQARLVIRHEDDCVASDAGITEIATRHGWTGAA
jgi:hypothetical protein